jgi:hypothetical protein
MTFAGTCEPTEPIGKLWWAVTGSNRRPSRCKRDAQQPSCVGYSVDRPHFGLFGSVSVPAGGSNGTARTSRLLAARIEARRAWFTRAGNARPNPIAYLETLKW